MKPSRLIQRWILRQLRLLPSHECDLPGTLHVLAGQRVGIKEVDEGIWIVSFIQYDLGYIDLEQKTLQPLDNPFGPRLSPMS